MARFLFFVITYSSIISPALCVEENPKQQLVVGVYENHPIVFKNENGEIQGIAIEVLEHVAQQRETKLVFQYEPWPVLLEKLEKSEIDVLVGIAYSKERAKKFHYTQQTLINNWGVVYQTKDQAITSLQQLQYKRVALMDKSIHSRRFIAQMLDFGFQFEPIYVKNYQQTFQAVNDGQADLAVVNRIFGLVNGEKYNLKETGVIFNPVEVRYAVPKTSTSQILSDLDRYLQLAKANKSSLYYQSIQNWLSVSNPARYTEWVFWGVIVISTILFVVLSYTIILSKQVKKRTHDLSESERNFRQLTETITEVFWLCAPNWQSFHYVSPAYEQIWGKSCKSLHEEPHSWLDSIHPNDKQKVLAIVNRPDYDIPKVTIFPDFRILHPNGEIRWILTRTYPVTNKQGKAIRLVGIAEDITKFKTTEQALRESEERFEYAVRGSNDGFWDWYDIENDKMWWSSRVYELLGYEANEVMPSMSMLNNLIHSEDIELAKQAINYHIEKQVDYDVEFRIRDKFQQIHWFRARGQALRDDFGHVIRMSGSYQDITEQKKVTESLRLYEYIVSSSRDLMSFVDTNFRYLAVNDAYLEAVGLTKQQMLGKLVSEVIKPEIYQKTVRPQLEKCFAGEEVNYRLWMDFPKYGRRYLEVAYFPFRDESGEIIGAVVDAYDLTAYKLTQQQLEESQHMLEIVLDTIPARVFWKNKESIYLGCNKLFSSDVGFKSPQALIGKTDFDFIASDQAARYQTDDQFILETGKVLLNKEECRVNGEDEPTWFEVSKVPLHDASGSMIGILGTYHDITSRKIYERKIQEVALAVSSATGVQFFESLVQYAAKLFNVDYAFIGLVNDEQNPSIVNTIAITARGKLQANFSYDLSQTPCANVISDSICIYPKQVQQKFPEDIMLQDMGIEAYFGIPIHNSQGNVIGLMALLHSKSILDTPTNLSILRIFASRAGTEIERTNTERELQHYQAHLQELVELRTAELSAANKEIEAFSYSVSHDLRAPLRAIDGFSFALYEDYNDVLDHTGKEYLQRVRKAAQRMSNLIDDMLQLAKLSRSEIKTETVDLSLLFQQAINKHRQLEPEREIDVAVAANVTAKGDVRLLEVLVSNLVDNAWKYSGKKARAMVSFGVEEQGDAKVFYIKDNGAGFDMQFADKLFNPFQRLHGPDDFEGTGVGLATVKRIVLRHGGEVWADSKPGQGATFYFTLSD